MQKYERYDKKIIISGNIIEVYEYEKEVASGFKISEGRIGRSGKAEGEEIQKNRELVLQRAKRDLRRIINSNVDLYDELPKFFTMTFKEDMTCLKQANYEFKKFRQRLEDNIGIHLKYSAVPEIQKERFKKYGQAVWHYHVIFYNLPYIKQSKLMEIWGNGGVNIKKIDKVDNVGAYMCKYMTKDNKDLVGQKCYFGSRGLYKPIVIKDKKLVESVRGSLQANKMVYQNIFENEFNKTLYSQYNMIREQSEEKVV